jgi:hypothetical protein
MIATPKDKQCIVCQHVKSLTEKNFRRYGGKDGDWKTVCRSCEAKAQKQRKLDRIEKKAVSHMLEAAAIGGANIPHTAEMLEAIMHYFGGTNGFASLLLKQYFESPPGSRIRTSVLEMIVRLAAKNTEQGGAKKPIQLYSEEELEEEIDKRIRQVASMVRTGGRVIDESQEEEAEAPGAAAALPAPAAADHSELLGLSTGGVEGLAGRVEVEATRSLEALQADRPAVGVPPVPGQRNAGDRRK